MKKRSFVLFVLLCVACVIFGPWAGAATTNPATWNIFGVRHTKHNLSISGPGTIKSLTEDRVCVFCHTPHNATPLTPLWNKRIDAVNYTPYTSSTFTTSHEPTGPSRLCLSCHDGTLALGEVLRPAERIPMTVAGAIPAGPTNFGTDLGSHHPVSFSYYSSLPDSELASATPLELLFYGNGIMQCNTCHDPHTNLYKKFLAVDSEQSQLCVLCHTMTGWAEASHNTSQSAWNGTEPNPWPRTGTGTDFGWTTVNQNGCESCHAPHAAGGPKRLLNHLEEEKNCLNACHNDPPNTAATNIQAQFGQNSRHHVEDAGIGVTTDHHETNEDPSQTGHVECVDCHNPHAANSLTAGSPPAVSSILGKVSGISIGGSPITRPDYAANEYEICFKCHASSSAQVSSAYAPDLISRAVNSYNIREKFQQANPSYHPVAYSNPGLHVPSIPSSYYPDMTTSSKIYCTDCHDSDSSRSIGGSGPRGSHGSQYFPLLRQQYVTEFGASYQTNSPNFALCYRCHAYTSIENNDSFKTNSAGYGGHSGHLMTTGPTGTAVYAPCSVCHDPHGIDDNTGGASGSHTYLINFDTRTGYVLPYGGNSYPLYNDTGSGTTHSGSCTLVCHDAQGYQVTHNGTSYP